MQSEPVTSPPTEPALDRRRERLLTAVLAAPEGHPNMLSSAHILKTTLVATGSLSGSRLLQVRARTGSSEKARESRTTHPKAAHHMDRQVRTSTRGNVSCLDRMFFSQDRRLGLAHHPR